MAIAFTQISTVKTGGSTAGSVTSNSLTTVSGRSLFAVLSVGSGDHPLTGTFSDSKGNTWAKDVAYASTENNNLTIFIGSCLNPTTMGAGHTVTFGDITITGGDYCIFLLEYSGLDTTATVDKTSTNSGTSTGPTSGALSASVSGSLYLGGENNSGSPTITPVSGWNQRGESETGSSAQPLSVIDQISSGSLNAGWTLGSSQAWGAAMAIYKPVVAAVTESQLDRSFPRGINRGIGRGIAKWDGRQFWNTGYEPKRRRRGKGDELQRLLARVK